MADQHVEITQISTKRQSQLVAELQVLAADAARIERDIEDAFHSKDIAQRESHAAVGRRLSEEHEQRLETVGQEYTNKLSVARKLYETQLEQLDSDQERVVEQVQLEKESSWKSAKSSWKRSRRDAKRSHAVSTKRCRDELEAYNQQCDAYQENLENLRDHATLVLRRRHCSRLSLGLQAGSNPTGSANVKQDFVAVMTQAVERFEALRRQTIAKFVDEGFLFLYFLLGTGLVASVGWIVYGWEFFSGTKWLTAIGLCCVGGVVITIVIGFGMYRFVWRQTIAVVEQLCEEIASADGSLRRMRSDGKRNASRLLQKAEGQLETELLDADAEWKRLSRELQENFDDRSIAANLSIPS